MVESDLDSNFKKNPFFERSISFSISLRRTVNNYVLVYTSHVQTVGDRSDGPVMYYLNRSCLV